MWLTRGTRLVRGMASGLRWLASAANPAEGILAAQYVTERLSAARACAPDEITEAEAAAVERAHAELVQALHATIRAAVDEGGAR